MAGIRPRPISELRLVIEYQSRTGSMRELTLDIVDYPGEWLLDLPLLGMSYEDWSAETIRLSQQPDRAKLAEAWHRDLASLDPAAPESEPAAQKAAQIFTEYLRACRDERFALSLLPPGRFLMPGELADSPALTFAPLDRLEGEAARGSQQAMMRRRYESYKDLVVRPFYRDHIARLDRQIVLVDVLTALNAGPDAVRDLERAMTAILDSFNVGRNSILSALFAPRIDRILFAATKADLLHHTSHDRLERILDRLVKGAAERAEHYRRPHRRGRARFRARDPRSQCRRRARIALRDRWHAARWRACRRSRFRRYIRNRDLSRRPAR